MISLHLKSTIHLNPHQADRAQVSARLISALGSPASEETWGCMGDWQGEWSCCILAGSESWSESLELVGDGDADAADVQVSMCDMIPPVSMPSQPVLVLFIISGPCYISLAVLWL